MTYTVIFNVGYRDCEVMVNANGFVEEFDRFEDATEEASKWLDNDQYRNFKVYAQCSHEKNHLV